MPAVVHSSSALPTAAPPPLTRRATIACGAIILLAGLVYVNALDNPFVYDDNRLILENRSLQSPTDVRSLLLRDAARPVVNVSYAVDRAIWGGGPFGFHLTNVLLHMTNVGLLFLLAWRVTAGRGPPAGAVAAGAALPFAVHPLLTEAVGYVAGRSEVLCATALLAALLMAEAWMRTDRVRWLLATVGLWFVALFTKETAGLFPFVLFAFDRLLVPGTPADRGRRLMWLHLPLLLVATVAVAVRLVVFLFFEYQGEVAVDWRLLLVELDVAVRYLRLLLLPTGQTIFHAIAPVSGVLDPRVLFAAGVIVALLGVGWRVRRTVPLVLFGTLAYGLFLVPSSVLVLFDRGEPMAEHRAYIAGLGIFLLVGAVAGRLAPVVATRRRAVRILVSAAVVLWVASLGAKTLLRNAVWGDPVVLWSEAMNLAPGHWLPQLALGEALQQAGRCDEAVANLVLSLDGHPDEPVTYRLLGVCLLDLRMLEEARAAFVELQRIAPGSLEASNGLGAVALATGDAEGARRYYEETLARDPTNVAAHTALAAIEEHVADDPEAALRHCEAVAALAPDTPGNAECISRNRARVAAAGSQ